MIDKAKIFMIYVTFFLLFFMQLPFSASLPGKTDCWWHIAVFSDFGNRTSASIHHLPITTSYFPAKALWLFGEPSFGVGAIYLLIHACAIDYVMSFYILYTFLFSFTALSFYLLAGQFYTARIPRIAGGIFFTSANFFLGHLDHHNTFFWAIAFLSIRSFYQFKKSSSIHRLYLMFIFGGIQIYFSTTIFVYLSLWLIILCSMDFKILTSQKVRFHAFAGSAIFIIICSPLVQLYANSPDIKNAYNPALFANGDVMSNLWPRDLLRFLPGNLIYSQRSDIEFNLLYDIKCAAPGLVLLTLFISGLRLLPKKVFLPIAIVAITLALGSEVKIGSISLPMPMKLYYSNFHDLPLLRTPIRAYFIVHWVLCMGAVAGLSRIRGSYPKKLALTMVLTILFLTENLPAHLEASPAKQIISESEDLANYLKQKDNAAVLHLPSQIFPEFPVALNGYQMNAIGREYLYSFIQTIYKKNTVNGSAGYFPPKRIAINEILQLRSSVQFENMLNEYNIKYVVWHDDLKMKDEGHLLDTLTSYPFLHQDAKIGKCIIFSAR